MTTNAFVKTLPRNILILIMNGRIDVHQNCDYMTSVAMEIVIRISLILQLHFDIFSVVSVVGISV